MPVDADRFRVKTTKGGKKIRLAFKGNKVVEATKLNPSHVRPGATQHKGPMSRFS